MESSIESALQAEMMEKMDAYFAEAWKEFEEEISANGWTVDSLEKQYGKNYKEDFKSHFEKNFIEGCKEGVKLARFSFLHSAIKAGLSDDYLHALDYFSKEEIQEARMQLAAKNSISINLMWDEEAFVWIATSDDISGLVLEAESYDELIARVKLAIPELVEINQAVEKEIDDDC